MYLPRQQIAQLYTELIKTTHPLSPPVLILTALTVDSLCATRILTALLKRDYIPHKVQPVNGYSDLQRAGEELVLPQTWQRGGEGGVVVCLGVGGLVDLEEVLGLDASAQNDGNGANEDTREHGVEVWVIDARRPWNLQNVFGSGVGAAEASGDESTVATRRPGVQQGTLSSSYRSGRGGVVVWDDGDIENELATEREAFMELQSIPELGEDDLALEGAESEDDEEPSSSQSRKRKAFSHEDDDEEASDDDERPRQRRRSNSSTPIPSSPGENPRSAQVALDSTPPTSSQPRSPAAIPSSPPKQPSQRQLKRQLLKLRRKHESTLDAYYNLGTSYSEPVSSMLYSLASELGREDNDLLWLAIVGISSIDLSPFSQPSSSSSSSHRRILDRAEQVREVLRDEVRRLNPIPDAELRRNQGMGDSIIPTHARSPTDTAIRLSPEPKFLLIRHWSLYDSMLHSPFLSTRLHVWSDAGRKRLNKLLAKMGVSLQEAGKGYVHMDMELKRSLRERILKFTEMYNLEGLIPGDDGRTGREGWGFVRSWGWKSTLSAVDVAMIVGAILEVGSELGHGGFDMKYDPHSRYPNYSSRVRALPTPPHSEDGSSQADAQPTTTSEAPDWTTHRFFAAYDSLNPTTTSATQGLSVLLAHISTAQNLHRAILRTGSALIAKKQIRHLRAFRMGVVKEGPDVPLFTHPGALTKLASWVSEAVAVLEAEKGSRRAGSKDDALVLGCLDEGRGVYVVVGLGGGGAGGKRVRSKAEIKEREEKKKRKEAARIAKKAEKARKRQERRRLQREIREANGLIDSDDEDNEGNESDETEPVSSSSDGSDSESDEEVVEARKQRGYGLNRFGQAFQEVVEETAARVRIDSFEHSVVEVKKEDLAGFLEALSLKSVIG
ncbi:DNA replication initiation factor cdc45 [Vermiconidia calcicola]|uniref:DNA replication initiation factor cdc45 n=1 Tax=Vermiconidia calcicola TaxID=1690605 RepID=A0ACC3NS02_9PEZI|nr:DNA replication initiation factor cdc45 [Vermiconidia calcicola]